MRRVLDSSVDLKWVVAEADTEKHLRLRDDFHNGLVELLAPDVFPIEIGHGLTRAERQKRITPAEGATYLADLLMLLPQLHPSLGLLPRGYEISWQPLLVLAGVPSTR
jgi:predicted nucleic acid-binding protein